MKYYLIAGERSGDLHAANLMRALKLEDPNAEFRFWGGEYMQEVAGQKPVRHYQDLSFMGFLEVAQNLGTIRRALKQCKADILANRPDVVILVDYAGFNMRIASFAKEEGIKTFYYISPKIWAWNTGRVHKINKVVDKMFVTLPFEKDFYKRFGYEVDYVGNPVNDAIAAFTPNPDFRKDNNLGDKQIIAVLPGSRKQEVEHMLHFMVSIIPPYLNDYLFVIAATPNLPAKYYQSFRRHDCIRIVTDQTYDLLSNARAALVTSGTATLETALFNIPQVVCYKTSEVSYLISKAVIKIKWISLVNLIANRKVVTELIQSDFNPSNLMKELDKVLFDGPFRDTQLDAYKEIKQAIGEAGAGAKAAKLMVNYLKG
ncbi:MAG: lipid-A-disaccharide synthase [Bacteroidota bacterium]